jgi:PST family polysaccharide transporter/lipopolysaccharide exporter
MAIDGGDHEGDPVPKAATSLRRGVAQAAFASGAVEMVTRALTIVLSIAVARALDPREVGLLGLGVIVVGILSVVTGCAETAGVIGRSGGSDPQYAWASTVVRGIATGALLALSPLFLPSVVHLLAGRESSSVELLGLIHVLLWQLVLDLAATYPRVLLQRRLSLIPLAGASLVQIIAHVSLSLVLLGLGYSAMGVATSTLVAGGLGGVLLWSRLFASPGPRWDGSIKAGLWKQTAASAARVFVGNFVGYLNGRVDNLLVAGVLGPAAMSFYGMAWSASRIPVWILSQALGPVLVPTLSHVRSDALQVERILRESLRHAYVLLVPTCAFLFVAAEPLVSAILGPRWLPVVPALRVMSVSILVAPLVVAINALFVATDRAHMTGLATAAQLATMVVFVVPLTVRWGVVGAAVGDLLSTAVLAGVFYALCRVGVPEVRWDVLQAAALPLLAVFPVGLLAWHLTPALPAGVVTLAGDACLLLVGYLAVISLLGGSGRVLGLAALVRDLVRSSSPAPMAPETVERH